MEDFMLIKNHLIAMKEVKGFAKFMHVSKNSFYILIYANYPEDIQIDFNSKDELLKFCTYLKGKLKVLDLNEPLKEYKPLEGGEF